MINYYNYEIGELHCPYKGCRSKSTALPHSLYRHIRAKHFADFPKLSPSCIYTFKSPAGELIRFDGILFI